MLLRAEQSRAEQSRAEQSRAEQPILILQRQLELSAFLWVTALQLTA